MKACHSQMATAHKSSFLLHLAFLRIIETLLMLKFILVLSPIRCSRIQNFKTQDQHYSFQDAEQKLKEILS